MQVFSFRISQLNNALVLAISGPLDMVQCDQFHEVLSETVARLTTGMALILDLVFVSAFDSEAMKTLLEHLEAIRECSGDEVFIVAKSRLTKLVIEAAKPVFGVSIPVMGTLKEALGRVGSC